MHQDFSKIKSVLRWLFVFALILTALQGQLSAQGLPGTGGNPPPAPQSGGRDFDFGSPSKFKDLMELVDAVVDYIFNIAVPIGFGVIIYAGIRFLTARGNPEEVTKAKAILKWAIVGLAIIFINKGFVALILDILGAETTPTP